MQCLITTKYTFTILSFFLLAISNHANAASIDISYGQQEYQVQLQDETVTLTPVGNAISFSANLTDDFSMGLNYQNWQDDKNFDNRVNTDVTLSTAGASLSYYLDNWSFSTNYSQSEVDTKISGLKRKQNIKNENIDSSSFGGSIGYGFAKNDWFYGLLISGLYSDWDFDKYQVKTKRDEGIPKKVTTEKSSGNSSSISSSLSAAYYIPLENETGLMLGGLLTWNYLVSGDSALISRNGRNINTRKNGSPRNVTTNSAALNSISGDDSYGQFALYASYDINDAWSVDIDTSINIASDYDAYTWSISLGHIF